MGSSRIQATEMMVQVPGTFLIFPEIPKKVPKKGKKIPERVFILNG
jgi:hypothetical protein